MAHETSYIVSVSFISDQRFEYFREGGGGLWLVQIGRICVVNVGSGIIYQLTKSQYIHFKHNDLQFFCFVSLGMLELKLLPYYHVF